MSAEHDAADCVQEAIEVLYVAVTKARYSDVGDAIVAITNAEDHLKRAKARLLVIYREKKA